jgi:hypothetical protein
MDQIYLTLLVLGLVGVLTLASLEFPLLALQLAPGMGTYTTERSCGKGYGRGTPAPELPLELTRLGAIGEAPSGGDPAAIGDRWKSDIGVDRSKFTVVERSPPTSVEVSPAVPTVVGNEFYMIALPMQGWRSSGGRRSFSISDFGLQNSINKKGVGKVRSTRTHPRNHE